MKRKCAACGRWFSLLGRDCKVLTCSELCLIKRRRKYNQNWRKTHDRSAYNRAYRKAHLQEINNRERIRRESNGAFSRKSNRGRIDPAYVEDFQKRRILQERAARERRRNLIAFAKQILAQTGAEL